MDDKKKILIIGFLLLCLIGLGVGLFYVFFSRGEGGARKVQPEQVSAVNKPSAAEDIPAFPATPLDSSDDLVRRLARELSTHPRLDAWLTTPELARKFVAAVDNIANGMSPRKQVEFFFPEEPFKILKKGGREYIDPSSYDRYNLPAEVFISFNSKDCIRYFRGLKPVFQEAYRELGYPTQDFEDTLKRAITELLEVPVVLGEVRLEKKVKTYGMTDPHLEGLSEAQKHFLRLGPANVEAVEIKLRELALGLGMAEAHVPGIRRYTAR